MKKLIEHVMKEEDDEDDIDEIKNIDEPIDEPNKEIKYPEKTEP